MDHNELDDVQCSLIDTGDCPGVLQHKFVLNGTREPCFYTVTFEKGLLHNVRKTVHNCNQLRSSIVYCMLELTFAIASMYNVNISGASLVTLALHSVQKRYLLSITS